MTPLGSAHVVAEANDVRSDQYTTTHEPADGTLTAGALWVAVFESPPTAETGVPLATPE